MSLASTGAGGASASGLAGAPAGRPAAPALPIESHALPNGLRVVLQPDRRQPLVAINLWYHVGSRNEVPGRTGLAHLFEHMLFQGSQHVGTNDHFRYLQQVGGVANGSTWFDRTNYFETLPSHHLDLGLWLESDRMGYLLPALDHDKLETQRQVVLNERRQRIDNQPYGRAFERLHELLYPPGHPYSWPVIGYEPDIAGATLDEVVEFFRTHYVPANAVLTLAGDFEPRQALGRVEHYFGEVAAGTAPQAPRQRPVWPSAERREVLPDRVELARVYLGFTVPAVGDRRCDAAELLAIVLGDGRSSPLYRDLVHDRELAQEVWAAVLPMEIQSTFLLVATARPGVEPDRLEEALRGHLATASRGELAADELERARNRMVAAHLGALQSLDRRADLLSRATTFFDDPERLNRELERYLGLGAGEPAAVATDFLRPDRGVVVHVVPAVGGGRTAG